MATETQQVNPNVLLGKIIDALNLEPGATGEQILKRIEDWRDDRDKAWAEVRVFEDTCRNVTGAVLAGNDRLARMRQGDWKARPGGKGESVIEIGKSATADTRTCDFANTSMETLLESSRQHIGDVGKALAYFSGKLTEAAAVHDYDKLTAIDWFHGDFITGFKRTGWWDNHRRIHRHHLGQADGVPEDVNLIDVLEFVADCVMAGMARSGCVYELKIPDDVLGRALSNTVELLKQQVVVKSK